MATEKFSNFGFSTLSSGIDNSTTSVAVTSASNFPTTGNFRIVVDSEIMLVTSVSSNTFTVTRGYESTSAVSHSILAQVVQVITSGSLSQFRADTITAGTYASRPSTGNARSGDLYLTTDGPYLNRFNGTVWSSYGPVYNLTPVITANFSWVNQLSATETVVGGVPQILAEGGRGNPSIAMRVKTQPSTPYTVTMGFVPTINIILGTKTNAFSGFVLRESGTGKIMNYNLFQADLANGDRYVSFSQPSATGSFTTISNFNGSITRGICWFQISNDGANIVWRMSADGLFYRQISTEAVNAHFTTAPDQIGYCVNGERSAISVFSWLES